MGRGCYTPYNPQSWALLPQDKGLAGPGALALGTEPCASDSGHAGTASPLALSPQCTADIFRAPAAALVHPSRPPPPSCSRYSLIGRDEASDCLRGTDDETRVTRASQLGFLGGGMREQQLSVSEARQKEKPGHRAITAEPWLILLGALE